MSGVTVKRVGGRRDLRRFVKVPFHLNRDHPQWVPPLISERMEFLNRRRNPYFEHAEAEYFLAERDGEPVGRVTAQVDERWDSYQGGNDGMFGFFETANDPQVAAALLDTAADWVRGRNRSRIVGPMDFTTNDETGILVDGYDVRPMILESWHPPHYKELIEAHGFEKAMDLLMWFLQLGELKEGDRFDPEIHVAAQRGLAEHGITIRNMRKDDMEAEVGRFMDVYNEAWGDNWGFVPVTEAEAAFQAKNLKQVLDEDWAYIAEKDGETIAAALSLPDVNQVLARMNGRLLPFGWLKFLRGKRQVDQLRVFALGVKRDFQHTGTAAGLYLRHIETAAWHRIKRGEMGWILETNEAMNRAMEGMGGKVVKRYRVYERSL